MRARTLLISIVAAVAASFLALAGWNGGLAAPTAALLLADNSPNAVPVDTELVIAVDVSNSMDPEEQELQREGYITGITSREFMSALKGGVHGKVAVTYFEWAGLYDQKIIMPWRLIDGPETADAVAREIATTRPATAEEVERAKTEVLKGFELAPTNTGRFGLELSEWMAMGDWRLFFYHRDQVKKVTPQDVQRVARQYLTPENRTVVITTPPNKGAAGAAGAQGAPGGGK